MSTQPGSAGSAGDPAVAVDRALFHLRFRLRPRTEARQLAPGNGCGPAGRPFEATPLLYAIAEGCGEVTVGGVAERLGIDPSRASRIVSAAIDSGQVTRLASQTDGRRTVLELTPAGRAVLAEIERHRRTRYEQIMAEWSPSERATFARLLTRFVEGL